MRIMPNPTDSVMRHGKAIYQYVFALAHGVSDIWYYKDWIKTPGVATVSCNDGLRPVIMKLETTDMESKPE